MGSNILDGFMSTPDENVFKAIETIRNIFKRESFNYMMKKLPMRLLRYMVSVIKINRINCDKCRLREMDTDDVYRCKLHHNVSDWCSPSDGYV